MARTPGPACMCHSYNNHFAFQCCNACSRVQYTCCFSAHSCCKTAEGPICLHKSNNKISPLPPQIATRLAPGHWGTPEQLLESLQKTIETAAETLRRSRQQQVIPEQNTFLTRSPPLPPPPPPPLSPPPATPISIATAAHFTAIILAYTDASQQYSSGALVSPRAPQQFLPQRLQGIPTLQQTAGTLDFDGSSAPTTHFFGTGPAIRNWQMMEQVPLADAQQVAFYESHRAEFQSWPSKLTFLAPPQDEWRLMMNSLFQLYTQAGIPNLPEFENGYAAAFFCSVAKNRVQSF